MGRAQLRARARQRGRGAAARGVPGAPQRDDGDPGGREVVKATAERASGAGELAARAHAPNHNHAAAAEEGLVAASRPGVGRGGGGKGAPLCAGARDLLLSHAQAGGDKVHVRPAAEAPRAGREHRVQSIGRLRLVRARPGRAWVRRTWKAASITSHSPRTAADWCGVSGGAAAPAHRPSSSSIGVCVLHELDASSRLDSPWRRSLSSHADWQVKGRVRAARGQRG